MAGSADSGNPRREMVSGRNHPLLVELKESGSVQRRFLPGYRPRKVIGTSPYCAPQLKGLLVI